MTPHEKYGLKTDVKSIRERTGKSYSDLLVKFITEQKEPQSMLGINYDSAFRHRWEEIKNADLALLCELAEKGERYEAEHELISHYRYLFNIVNFRIALDEEDELAAYNEIKRLEAIISEAEGEGK